MAIRLLHIASLIVVITSGVVTTTTIVTVFVVFVVFVNIIIITDAMSVFAVGFVTIIVIYLDITVSVIFAATNIVPVKVDCHYQIVTFCLRMVSSCKSLEMNSMVNSHFRPRYNAQGQSCVELLKWCSALAQQSEFTHSSVHPLQLRHYYLDCNVHEQG